jgi:hypothetical protein
MQARMHNASCVVRRLLRVLALRAVPQRRRGEARALSGKTGTPS